MSTTEICKDPKGALREYGFGSVLKFIRYRSGLTGAEVAHICGFSYNGYMNKEGRRYPPSFVSTIQSLEKAYGELIWHICGFDTIKRVRIKLNALSKMPEQASISKRRR